LSGPRADDRVEPGTDAGGPHGHAARHCERRLLPLLARSRHGSRPDDRRRRRLLPPRLMEPTEENRRAWDKLQQAREEITQERTTVPDPVRELLPDLHGKHVLHELCGTGATSGELASLG